MQLRRSAIDRRQDPDPALSAAFAEALGHLWPEGGRLGLAVSGGPDSLALLLLAAARPGLDIEAATVDHGLRPQSGAEAALVARLCEELGVRHAILPVRLEMTGNLQAMARSARYAALASWMAARGLDALATAHHVEDQAETLIMRLNRASGLGGLAGIRSRTSLPDGSGLLLRPLLAMRRDALRGIVEAAGLVAVDDPSNRAERFDRARIRRALAGADWLDPAALAASSSHLADADEALDWAAGMAWERLVTESEQGFDYRPQAPRALALRLLGRILSCMGESNPRGSAVARLHDGLASGRAMSLGTVVARPGKAAWRFRRAPQRRHDRPAP